MTTQALTVLFTDMVESTRLLAGLGTSEAEELLHAHFAMLAHHVVHRGGREIKRLGDGVMATFPAASTAIDAATGMHHAVAHTQLPACQQKEPPQIRIGISSGDVAVHNGDCYGRAVVEASRLCAQAQAAQTLISESTRLLTSSCGPLDEVGEIQLKGLPDPVRAWQVRRTNPSERSLRVVLADDAALLREGIARVLRGCGIEVLAQAADANELIRLTAELHPDVAIVDLRMPPSHTTEGIDAAERIIAAHPLTSVLVLSQDVEPRYAQRLLRARTTGVGYLLKERVIDVKQFEHAVRSVAAGGCPFDPLLACREDGATDPAETLETYR